MQLRASQRLTTGRFRAFLFAAALGFASPAAHAAPDEGKILRAFLNDMISASAVEPARQAEEMRKVFARYPEVFEWVADGRDLNEITTRAGLERSVKSALGTQDVGELVRTKVEQRAVELLGQIGEKAIDVATMDPQKAAPILRAASQNFSNHSEEERVRILRMPGDLPFQEVSAEVAHSIQGASLGKIDAIDLLLNQEKGIKVADPGIKMMVEDVLPKYFGELPLDRKRRMIQALLALPPDAPLEKQLGTLLQEAGPIIQKGFQLVGKDARSPTIQKALAELESNVKPFDGKTARALIEKELRAPISSIFSEFDEKPLASATVGQVHRAKLIDPPQWVIIKIQRPGIRDAADEEIKMLLKATQGTLAESMIVKIQESFDHELNFMSEARNLKSGEVYVNEKRGIGIARQVKNTPATERMIITYFAKGKKATDVRSTEELVALGQSVKALLEQWFENAIFGDGFFHGDLHPGNYKFQYLKDRKPPYLLTLIDFGNADKLSIEERRGFMELAVAAISQSPEKVLDALKKVGKIPPEKEAALMEQLRGVHYEKPLASRLTEIMTKAVEWGLEIDTSLLAFNRGRMFLEKQLYEINKRLSRLDRGRGLPRFEASRIYASAAARKTMLGMFKGLFSSEARREQVVPFRCVMDLLKAKTKGAVRAMNPFAEERR